MGHSPRRIQFQLFKTFTLKMKTFIFLATAVVLTTYSSPVPNPKPQIYNNKFFDYSQDCYDSQCQQNNQIGGGNQGGYNNYDYDYYGGGRGQGGNRRRFQGGVAGGNKQNCVGSQCQQNFDGKDHSNFFTDSFWNRRRNGRNSRY